MDDELLDLVDEKDEIIGTLYRSEYHRIIDEQLGYIRAVDLFLVNSRGEVFVPTRTAHKTIAPSGYDYSVGGHVSLGEDYLTSLVREAEEELNVKIDQKSLIFIEKNVFDDIRYIISLYAMKFDETPNINPDDFTHAEWKTPAKLISEIDDGHPAKSSLRHSANVLLQLLESKSL